LPTPVVIHITTIWFLIENDYILVIKMVKEAAANCKDGKMDKERYLQEMYARNPPGSLAALRDKTVGIAGLGGLGSTVAVSLLRAGVQRFILADHDRVELSNLNRQHYFHPQVGMEKTAALRQNLLAINPFVQITTQATQINSENLGSLFADANLLIEAFDSAEMKRMVALRWSQTYPDRFLVMGSGISGYGLNNRLSASIHGRIVICGDQTTEETAAGGLTATRVGLVAQMQANAALEILLNGSCRC
jgi:sulfur carrier protein ThiS adenylyltransferase